MNKIIKFAVVSAAVMTGFSSCIKEIDPQSSVVTQEQVANVPGSFDGLVSGIYSGLVGSFTYSGSNYRPYDFGYPTFFLVRDLGGQDIALDNDGDWFWYWYCCMYLGPHYAMSQLPMTYYYGWINDCNTVIGNYKLMKSKSKTDTYGAGQAYALRAMFYLDVAQMYGQNTYASNPKGLTAPIRSDENSGTIAVARATWEEMCNFILSDLNTAEQYLNGYTRDDVYTINQKVVYGLKARTYLLMQDWANAEAYANKARQGFKMMEAADYLSQTNGFNTPNQSWMFGVTYLSTDANITASDGDSSWGSQMIIEVAASGCGYAANYGDPKRIDAHLQSTIPASDFRSKCFIDPAIDDMNTAAQKTALAAYTDAPEGIITTASKSTQGTVGGLSVKFRPKDGEHSDQYKAFCVAVPLMRVEEMMLIEAEAAGMQDETRGIELLKQFATQRDPNYVYGTHQEKYYGTSTTPFQDEVWWQRRVELWGEGFAMFDIKRQQRGIIRSYKGTNHVETYRWNMEETPQWMTTTFVQTESKYNNLLIQNPTPEHESVDDPEYEF